MKGWSIGRVDRHLVKDGDWDGKGGAGVGNVHYAGQAALAWAAGQQQVDLRAHDPLPESGWVRTVAVIRPDCLLLQ